MAYQGGLIPPVPYTVNYLEKGEKKHSNHSIYSLFGFRSHSSLHSQKQLTIPSSISYCDSLSQTPPRFCSLPPPFAFAVATAH